MGSSIFTVKHLLTFVVLPYFVGFFWSQHNLSHIQKIVAPYLDQVFSRTLVAEQTTQDNDYFAFSKAKQPFDVDVCYSRLLKEMLVPIPVQSNFEGLQMIVHRNGEADRCGSTTLNLVTEFKHILGHMSQNENKTSCPIMGKYEVESLLTRLYHKVLVPSCTSTEQDRSSDTGFYGYCDMGPDKTPILSDHGKLIPIPFGTESYLPCHFHDLSGVRVTSLRQLADLVQRQIVEESECTANGDCHDTRELQLYAVPAGRVFLHTPSYVGQIISLPHVTGGDPDLPVTLEVLSVRPAVFDIHNFFTKAESQGLVDQAMVETRALYKMQRSSTGAVTHEVNVHRTSESGFVTSGETSMAVKRRCFDVLGFDEYIESHADGLQILRYNLTTAYMSHMDWIDGDDSLEHDYESAAKGGNRFATILLYMSDLGEMDGGETVFTEAWPANVAQEDRINTDMAIQQLRESDRKGILEEGSWEESLVAQCRTKLAIHPNSARAVLFYSQLPNGMPDRMSLHGACPVLAGTKWAANLWVWNTPRAGYADSPKNPNYKSNDGDKAEPQVSNDKVLATFRNGGSDPKFVNAALYYQSDDGLSFWGKLGPNDPQMSVNTYPGHIWVLKVNEEIVKSWTITSADAPQAQFVV